MFNSELLLTIGIVVLPLLIAVLIEIAASYRKTRIVLLCISFLGSAIIVTLAYQRQSVVKNITAENEKNMRENITAIGGTTDRIRETGESTSSDLIGARSQVSYLQQTVTDLNSDLSQSSKQYLASQARIVDLQREVVSLQSQISSQGRETNEAQKSLKNEIAIQAQLEQHARRVEHCRATYRAWTDETKTLQSDGGVTTTWIPHLEQGPVDEVLLGGGRCSGGRYISK